MLERSVRTELFNNLRYTIGRIMATTTLDSTTFDLHVFCKFVVHKNQLINHGKEKQNCINHRW